MELRPIYARRGDRTTRPAGCGVKDEKPSCRDFRGNRQMCATVRWFPRGCSEVMEQTKRQTAQEALWVFSVVATSACDPLTVESVEE